MTDIVERKYIAGEGGCPSCEMKEAEIEALVMNNKVKGDVIDTKQAEIERLQAVVDAAITMLKEGMHNSALAALEDKDE